MAKSAVYNFESGTFNHSATLPVYNKQLMNSLQAPFSLCIRHLYPQQAKNPIPSQTLLLQTIDFIVVQRSSFASK